MYVHKHFNRFYGWVPPQSRQVEASRPPRRRQSRYEWGMVKVIIAHSSSGWGLICPLGQTVAVCEIKQDDPPPAGPIANSHLELITNQPRSIPVVFFLFNHTLGSTCRPAPKVGLSGSNLIPPSAKNLVTKEMKCTKERTKESNVTGQRKVQKKPMSGARGSLLRALLRPSASRFHLLPLAVPIPLH